VAYFCCLVGGVECLGLPSVKRSIVACVFQWHVFSSGLCRSAAGVVLVAGGDDWLVAQSGYCSRVAVTLRVNCGIDTRCADNMRILFL
jgi:hypothetical protein